MAKHFAGEAGGIMPALQRGMKSLSDDGVVNRCADPARSDERPTRHIRIRYSRLRWVIFARMAGATWSNRFLSSVNVP